MQKHSPPERRRGTTLRPPIVFPLAHREAVSALGRPGAYLLRVLPAAALALAASLLPMYTDHSVRAEHLHVLGLVAEAALRHYPALVVLLFVPLISSASLATEKENGLLPLLFCTPFRPRDLVLSKFAAAWVQVLWLLMAVLPAAAALAYPVEVDLAGHAWRLLVFAFIAAGGCAFGVFASAAAPGLIFAYAPGFGLMAAAVYLNLRLPASTPARTAAYAGACLLLCAVFLPAAAFALKRQAQGRAASQKRGKRRRKQRPTPTETDLVGAILRQKHPLLATVFRLLLGLGAVGFTARVFDFAWAGLLVIIAFIAFDVGRSIERLRSDDRLDLLLATPAPGLRIAQALYEVLWRRNCVFIAAALAPPALFTAAWVSRFVSRPSDFPALHGGAMIALSVALFYVSARWLGPLVCTSLRVSMSHSGAASLAMGVLSMFASTGILLGLLVAMIQHAVFYLGAVGASVPHGIWLSLLMTLLALLLVLLVIWLCRLGRQINFRLFHTAFAGRWRGEKT